MPAIPETLGVLMAQGKGVGKDPVAAVQWYRKAAAQEHTAAHTALGRHSAEGLGTAKDDIQAYMWFSLATMLGDKTAATSQETLVQGMTPDQISKARTLTWKRLEERKKN